MDIQTYKQTDIHIDIQTYKQIDIHIGIQTYRQTYLNFLSEKLSTTDAVDPAIGFSDCSRPHRRVTRRHQNSATGRFASQTDRYRQTQRHAEAGSDRDRQRQRQAETGRGRDMQRQRQAETETKSTETVSNSKLNISN